MRDNLDYRVNEENQTTAFRLAAGTKLKLGVEDVELATDSDIFFIRKNLSRDGLVDLLVSTGQAAANSVNFPYSYENEDGKTVEVTYGGRGQRIETVVEPEPEEVVEEAEQPKKRSAKK